MKEYLIEDFFYPNDKVIPTCKTLIIYSKKIVNKIDNIPKGVRKVVIYNTYIYDLDNLPSSIVSIQLNKYYKGYIHHPNLKELVLLDGCKMDLSHLPLKLRKLEYLGYNHANNFNFLPPLKDLCIITKQIEYLDNLPNSIKCLTLVGTTKFYVLPSTLEKLKIEKNLLKNLKILPRTLKKIEIIDSHTYWSDEEIKSLHYLKTLYPNIIYPKKIE